MDSGEFWTLFMLRVILGTFEWLHSEGCLCFRVTGSCWKMLQADSSRLAEHQQFRSISKDSVHLKAWTRHNGTTLLCICVCVCLHCAARGNTYLVPPFWVWLAVTSRCWQNVGHNMRPLNVILLLPHSALILLFNTL